METIKGRSDRPRGCPVAGDRVGCRPDRFPRPC